MLDTIPAAAPPLPGIKALIRRPWMAYCDVCVRAWPSATPEGARILADSHGHGAVVVAVPGEQDGQVSR